MAVGGGGGAAAFSACGRGCTSSSFASTRNCTFGSAGGGVAALPSAAGGGAALASGICSCDVDVTPISGIFGGGADRACIAAHSQFPETPAVGTSLPGAIKKSPACGTINPSPVNCCSSRSAPLVASTHSESFNPVPA